MAHKRITDTDSREYLLIDLMGWVDRRPSKEQWDSILELIDDTTQLQLEQLKITRDTVLKIFIDGDPYVVCFISTQANTLLIKYVVCDSIVDSNAIHTEDFLSSINYLLAKLMD